MKKRITSLILCLTLLIIFTHTGFASVLGSSRVDGYTVTIGSGTTFTSQSFYSDQSGVGLQTEHYVTYETSTDVEPIITHGTYLYGTKKISDETSRLSNSVNLTAGINADFFSLQTGVPMSNLISNGKIVSKDASGQDMLAIMEDGTAFISYATLASVLIKEDGTEVNIYNINKYRQPYAAYLLTSEFSDTTRTTTPGYDIILGSVEGEMRLGSSLTAVVEQIQENDSSIPIPEDKMILTIDKNAPAEFLDPISTLAVGEKITLSFGVMGDDTRWNSVKTAMGSVGGRLLINGEINSNLEAGAAPRTAIGIKEDGSLLLYTIDGRQSGYSYGVQLKTLAARMKELGCTDAINLDGGGSTSIVSLLPGDGVPTLKNKPSDGRERGVSTFFFLKNNLNPTGELGSLTFYPLTAYILTGAKKQFSLKAADTGFHPLEVPDGISFSVVTEGAKSELNSVGMFTAKDNGTVRIKAEKDGVVALMDVVCLETPTDIIITNLEGETVTSAYVEQGGEFQFTASAYGGYNKLTAENSDFTWSVSEDIGTIDENGKFTARQHINAKGAVNVTAGSKTVSIPVTVSFTPDKKNPDSYPQVSISVDKNENTLTAPVGTPLGIPVNKEDIILKADGVKLDFEFNEAENKIYASYPIGTSRITLYVRNTADLSGFGYADLITEKKPAVFADAEGHWAEQVLAGMYEMGIINGEQSGDDLIFRPQKQMNRSEFAVMICNYLEIDVSEFENTALPFDDADKIPAWALNATKALYAEGIAKGKTTADGKLIGEPLSSITRAEAATIITRTLKGSFYLKDFAYTDMADIPEWADTGMRTLMSLGAMNGYTDGRVLPLGLLTKAEAAKLLYSIL